MRTFESSPHPAILIESLRDFGYSLETALADVIDNSLAANASRIDILVESSDQDDFIAIVDNGTGMSKDRLLEAMRLGSQSPLEERQKQDLGRFGLGLKTASFSQCRKLTVVSRHDGNTLAATWDLDHVTQTNKWSIIIPNQLGDIPGYDHLKTSGTLVVWQKLDRLTETPDRKSHEQYFAERISDARTHLELVFHRFMVREGKNAAVSISINGRPLSPIDPFLSDHPATQRKPVETIVLNHHQIVVEGFTLPDRKSVSRKAWDRVGGQEGHIKNQGFYVYRERRLIIWGTWFGLATKSEPNKLARVKVDIGNDTDADWKIDVRKSSAQPPLLVRQHLKRIIESLTESSRAVNVRRPRQSSLSSHASGWLTFHDKTHTKFQPNPEHPLITSHIASLSDQQRTSFELVIKMLTSSLPLDHIHARMSSKPDELTQAQIDPDDLYNMVVSVASALQKVGLDDSRIRTQLRFEEPFKSNWEQVKSILENIPSQENGEINDHI